MKKILNILSVAFSLVLFFTACMKDGEILTVSVPEGDIEFSTDKTSVNLAEMDDSDLAFTIFWNAEAVTPTVNNPNVSLTDDSMSLTLQFSLDESFSSVYEMALDAESGSKQFTMTELNAVIARLGGTEAVTVYLRLMATLADNVEPRYSETAVVSVTPLVLDMTVMSVVSNAGATSGTTIATLHSTEAMPDRYSGFVVFPNGWFNFYCDQADGTRWGNDGEVGTPYMISDASSQWNFWGAEPAGCMYLYIDLDMKEWWQIYIPTLTISGGEASADMKFSTSTGKWTGTFTTTADNAAITVSGTGQCYDISTGTDAGAVASRTPAVGITLNSDNTITYVEDGTPATYTADAAGTYTLTIDVLNGTWAIESGAPAVEYSEYYYALYTWEDSGYWTEALASTLYSPEKDGVYSGYVTTYVGSEYGSDPYRHITFSDTPDCGNSVSSNRLYADSSDKTKLLSSGGTSLYFGNDSSNPATGLYRVGLDLTANTWTEEALEISVCGIDDKWTLGEYPLIYDSATGTYSVTFEITKVAWGLQVVLSNDVAGGNWTYIYKDAGNGVLSTAASDNIPATEVGKYTLTVDLRNMSKITYTMTAVE